MGLELVDYPHNVASFEGILAFLSYHTLKQHLSLLMVPLIITNKVGQAWNVSRNKTQTKHGSYLGSLAFNICQKG
jgi:hypothetical protein